MKRKHQRRYKMALVHEARADFSAALPFAELVIPRSEVQGYLAYKETHPPRTLP